VILGHVDSTRGPVVLFRLRELGSGWRDQGHPRQRIVGAVRGRADRAERQAAVPDRWRVLPTLTLRCGWWPAAGSSRTAQGTTGPTASSSPRSEP